MELNSNPPIKGHRLLYAGHSVRHVDPLTEEYDGTWDKGCECGAKPAYSLTVNEMRRWHRAHKAALRSEVDS